MRSGTKQPTDYALLDVLQGGNSAVTRNKRRWCELILGPDGRKYSRMLFKLPPLPAEESDT